MNKELEDHIDLTPDNFCYLSNCKFFLSDIRSTGCKLDYSSKDDNDICPLAMERSLRSNDQNWNPARQKVAQKLRDLTESFKKDKEIMDKMGAEAYREALMRCAELNQNVYDAKIQYEKLQFELQEIKDMCFGQFEKEKR